jgi:NADP-dependent alcohol dehydrogenase
MFIIGASPCRIFQFYNPVRIHFGANSHTRVTQEIPANARVMILYGGGSVLKHGTLAEVKAALADRYCVEFGGIEPNPTYETLLKAITLAREERIDFLLAVGGGSVIDGTKFVAAAIGHAGDCTELMTSKGKAIKHVMPFGVVLTLAAHRL